MIIFTKNDNYTIAIPLEKIYSISEFHSSIIINFDNGETIEGIEGTIQKKVESIRIVYDSEDDVNKTFRQFYKACNSGCRAFYFGGSDSNNNKIKGDV